MKCIGVRGAVVGRSCRDGVAKCEEVVCGRGVRAAAVMMIQKKTYIAPLRSMISGHYWHHI